MDCNGLCFKSLSYTRTHMGKYPHFDTVHLRCFMGDCSSQEAIYPAFPAAMPVDVSAVVKDWMGESVIIQRAAVGKVMSMELGIDPDAAQAHAIILAPVMKHLGLLIASIWRLQISHHLAIASKF